MEVLRKGIDIIPDNEDIFISHLLSIIESSDELCSIQISKVKYTNHIIKEITKFSTLFEVRLDISKSIKSTGIISFSINLEN